MPSTPFWGAKPYGVALSSASVFSMGPGLVADYTRRETHRKAEALAAAIESAQPGIIARVAVKRSDGWYVDGLTVSNWIQENT
jgi:hypothetical protein